MPPSRGIPAPVKAWWAVPRPRCSRSRPPDSMSQYQAVMNHPGGSQARAARICRFSEALGVLHLQGGGAAQERDRDRLAWPLLPGVRPRRRRASGAWFVLALPLEYLHDHFRLPRVNQLRAFPGGDADLEPDLDPARPFPLRYIIADHTPIRGYSRQITIIIFPGFPQHFLLPFTALFPHCLSVQFPGVFPGAAAPHAGRSIPSPSATRRGARRTPPVQVEHPAAERPGPAAGGVLGSPWPAGTGWPPPPPQPATAGRLLHGPGPSRSPRPRRRHSLYLCHGRGSPFRRRGQVPAAGQHEPQHQQQHVGRGGRGARDHLQHDQGQRPRR